MAALSNYCIQSLPSCLSPKQFTSNLLVLPFTLQDEVKGTRSSNPPRFYEHRYRQRPYYHSPSDALTSLSHTAPPSKPEHPPDTTTISSLPSKILPTATTIRPSYSQASQANGTSTTAFFPRLNPSSVVQDGDGLGPRLLPGLRPSDKWRSVLFTGLPHGRCRQVVLLWL
jgi:hypothetical protein